MIHGVEKQAAKVIENLPKKIIPPKKAVQTSFQGEIAPEIVKKSTADASKAYGFAAIEKKVKFENKSIDEYIKDLLSQGKVEGKDFKITKIGGLATNLELLKNGKIYQKIIWYKNSDQVRFKTVNYPINTGNSGVVIKEASTLYDKNSKFLSRETIYDINKHPFKDELVKYGSTPEELMAKLTAQGRTFYKELANADFGHFTRISSFNPKTKLNEVYEFGYNKKDKLMEIKKTSYNNDNRTETLWFSPDEVSCVNYQNNIKY